MAIFNSHVSLPEGTWVYSSSDNWMLNHTCQVHIPTHVDVYHSSAVVVAINNPWLPVETTSHGIRWNICISILQVR